MYRNRVQVFNVMKCSRNVEQMPEFNLVTRRAKEAGRIRPVAPGRNHGLGGIGYQRYCSKRVHKFIGRSFQSALLPQESANGVSGEGLSGAGGSIQDSKHTYHGAQRSAKVG
jgi:hypothetical protein